MRLHLSLPILFLMVSFIFPLPGMAGERDEIIAVVTALTAQDMAALKNRADDGDLKAQTVLGMAYALGKSAPQDSGEAVKWYGKAAERGFPIAQYELAMAYDSGSGVARNKSEAVKWYRKAAEQGFAEAQNNLGFAYEHGQGITKNYSEAVKWYQKAAEQGSKEASFNLGLLYVTGKGIAQDYVAAYMWFSLVAAEGDPQAMKNIAQLKQKMTSEQTKRARQQAADWWAKHRKSPVPGSDKPPVFL